MFSNESKINIIVMYYTLKINKIIGKTRIQILTTTFNIHMHTIYNWITIFVKSNNDISNFISTLNKNNIHLLHEKLKLSILLHYSQNPTYSKYSNKKITSDIEKFIVSSITQNCKITVKTLRTNIKSKFNVDISKGSVYVILHKNNLTNKKLIIKTNPYTKEQQEMQRVELSNKLTNIPIDNVISIDEMSFNLSSEPKRGWSPKGKKCIVDKLKKNVRGKRFSIIMATSNSKIIDYSIVEGSVNTLKFISFITKITTNNPNKIIFMDNCIIHKSKQMFNLIRTKNLNVIFNVPYHSEYNPIEYVFSMLRKHLNNNVNDSFDDLHNLLKTFKLNMDKNKLTNIFNKCFRAINGIP